jgi:formate hydrogenlyase subunit 3/multisubunit Na+/H+ antiporter MnhD subunit
LAAARKYLSLAFGLLFAVGAALTFFVMFKAGCAGDTKGGALGNPVRSLQLENLGMLFLLLSAAAGGAAIGFASKSKHRDAQGIAFAMFTLIGLWLLGIQFETWGVQSCFQP